MLVECVCYSNAETLGGFVLYLFFLFEVFHFFQGIGRELPLVRVEYQVTSSEKKNTSEVPGSDVSTSNRVVASSGSGEMVGRWVADNDEFT